MTIEQQAQERSPRQKVVVQIGGEEIEMTPRQFEIAVFISSFIKNNGYAPSIREIGSAAKISSTSVVNYNLHKLVALGVIERDPEIARAMRLLAPIDINDTESDT